MLLLGGSQSTFDPALLARFYAGENAGLAGAAKLLTHFGGFAALTLVLAAAALWLATRKQWRSALTLLAIVMGGRALVALQKTVTARERPAEPDQLVLVHSLSFPSGHAANATITFLAIALFLAPRRIAIAVALGLAFLIGLSRLVLGVHWPSDVVGGWAFGLAWTLALVRITQKRALSAPENQR